MIFVSAFEGQEFARPNWFAPFYLAVAALSGLVGLLMLVVSGNRAGIVVCAMAAFWLGVYVWAARTPCVRTTSDSLTAFVSPLHKAVVLWDDVRAVDVKGRLMGGTLMLTLRSDRRVQVSLGYLDRGARQELVQHVQDTIAARARQDADGPKTDAFS